jgi:hypothetical protein
MADSEILFNHQSTKTPRNLLLKTFVSWCLGGNRGD